MKKIKFKNFILIVLTSILLLTGCDKTKEHDSYQIAVLEFNKHGNVILDTNIEDMKEKNIEPADIITVTIGENNYDIPVGTSYSDVDSGNMICRFDTEGDYVILAINGGSFAESTQMAIKNAIEAEPGYSWDIKFDKVSVTLKKKGGYKDEYTIRNLNRTNIREDYGNLTDAQFANCRMIASSSIKENMLYRGTTPLDSDLNRDKYAMAFVEENGIKSIINLVDAIDEMKTYDTYANSYYANCKIWNANMDYDFTSSIFALKTKECIKFMLDNDGPFYIHCKEGKDRTGVFCAIIECFLNATYEEVIDDYMLTYTNFYHIEKGSDTYNTILQTNIVKVLCNIFNVSNLKESNLQSLAEKYLLSTGLTNKELNSFKIKFGK